jgi:hypothetical protein
MKQESVVHKRVMSAIAVSVVAVLGVPVLAGTAGAADAATTKFCDANFAISLLFNTVSDEPTPKELKALAKQLKPLLASAQKSAPSEIATDVDTAVTALKADVTSLFSDDAVGEAGAAIDEWAVDNCDYETIDVTATDYAFAGVPTTLEKGKFVFQLQNDGAEHHVLVIARNKGTMTTDEILALPEAKALKQIELVGETFAPAGGSGTGYVNITKSGDYIVLCPIPTGTVGDTEGTGPPHFVHGMVSDLEVE